MVHFCQAFRPFNAKTVFVVAVLAISCIMPHYCLGYEDLQFLKVGISYG